MGGNGNNQVPSSQNGSNGGGSGKALPVILGLVLAVALAIGAYFLFVKKDDEESENTAATSSSQESSASDGATSETSETSDSSETSESESSSDSSSSSSEDEDKDSKGSVASGDAKKWGGDDTLPEKYRTGLAADTSGMVKSCRNGTFNIYHYKGGDKVDDGSAEGTRCHMGSDSPSPYTSVTYLTSNAYAKNKLKEAKSKNFKEIKDDSQAYVGYLKEASARASS